MIRVVFNKVLPAPVVPWVFTGLLVLVVSAMVALGHDGKRTAQLMLLGLPLLLLPGWPRLDSQWRVAARMLAAATAVVFCLDGVFRGYIQHRYGAAPDSSLVLSAMANTHVSESLEYLRAHWRSVGGWVLLGLVSCAVSAWLAWRTPDPMPSKRLSALGMFLIVALLLGAVAHASKPWRRMHPVVFWMDWTQQIHSLQVQWRNFEHVRQANMDLARQMHPVVTSGGTATVVLVITDSINRDNMSLYGYARATTPRLQTMLQAAGSQAMAWKGWSAHASTLPSVRSMMAVSAPATGQGEAPVAHLLALARAAGYKVWWMSNHDDLAIDQEHGRHADVVEYINKQPGRSSRSLDEELLDCLGEALHDAAPRKLVVLHLMGAHPHYRLRFPADWPAFDAHDVIDDTMLAQDWPAWLRAARRDYDRAIHYHEGVVADTWQQLQAHRASYRAWAYLSDHGQEVGHETAQAGHSPTTAAGYKVPALVWRSAPALDPAWQARLFRVDWSSHTLADLLHLQWPGRPQGLSVLGERYAWQPPPLPVRVDTSR